MHLDLQQGLCAATAAAITGTAAAAITGTAAAAITGTADVVIFVVMLVPSSGMQRPGRFRPHALVQGPQLLPRWGLWRQRLLERDRDQGLLHGGHLVHRILWRRWALVDVPWRVRLEDAQAQLQYVHEAKRRNDEAPRSEAALSSRCA